MYSYYFAGDEQPTPGMSYLEFDINKHTTDLLGLYRYVAAKVHRYSGSADLELPITRYTHKKSSKCTLLTNLLSYV